MSLGDGNKTLKQDLEFAKLSFQKERPKINDYIKEYKWILLLIFIVIFFGMKTT